MNAAMLQNPAIEDPRLARLRRGWLAAGQVARRVCRHKRRECVTEIGRDQDHQPKAGDVARVGRPRTWPAGPAAPADSKRGRRLPKPGPGRCATVPEVGCCLWHQPAVEGQQPLLDAVVRTLKELPGLPVRHQEESYGEPVAQDGNVERGKETRPSREPASTATNGTSASRVMFHRARARQGARKAPGSRPPRPG